MKSLGKTKSIPCPKCGAGTGFYLYRDIETHERFLKCPACGHEIPVKLNQLGL